MKRLFLGAMFCSFLLAPFIAWAQAKMTIKQIANNVYFMENPTGSSNATFVITNDGVLVFDFDIRTADQTLAAIRRLTDKKIKYIISSHSAGDHATGAWHFREDKPIYIASKNQIHDLQMQEAREFEERKQSNEPNNAAYKGKELVRPDLGIESA